MSERRYSEEEIEAIFERAAEAQQTGPRRLSPAEGLTLPELQEIAKEVGIPGELVVRAARSLERSGQPMSQKFFGFPIGVGRTVELGRRLTDEEWDRLVVDLRETFDARGRLRMQGAFREWTNGNLQALLEPTETGHRLRLRTMKGNSRGLMSGGVALIGMAAATLVAFALAGKLGAGESWSIVAYLSAIGGSMFGIGALQLPGWARLRQRQMDGVAARLALADETEPTSLPPADDG